MVLDIIGYLEGTVRPAHSARDVVFEPIREAHISNNLHFRFYVAYKTQWGTPVLDPLQISFLQPTPFHPGGWLTVALT